MEETTDFKETARNLIARHEGLRLKPYKCTAGKLTIGYGRNLDAKGISTDEARTMLDADIRSAYDELVGRPWFDEQNNDRKAALMDMCFNLGLGGLMSFKKMIEALTNQDYDEAARQMLNSKWAVQVGRRAETLARIMRDGCLEPEL